MTKFMNYYNNVKRKRSWSAWNEPTLILYNLEYQKGVEKLTRTLIRDLHESEKKNRTLFKRSYYESCHPVRKIYI